MYVIKDDVKDIYVVNKSKFITLLFYVDSIEKIKEILKNVKKEYSDANHWCYGYIVGNFKKASDDGEPSKTAGMPILNVLESNNLDNILCIVVRYFGGVKLGAGGLVRAYSTSASNCLKKTSIIEAKNAYVYKITFDYDNVKNIDYILKNVIIKDKQYKDNITYHIILEDENIINELSKYSEIVKENSTIIR